MQLISKETELVDGLRYRVLVVRHPAVSEEQVITPEVRDEEGNVTQAEIRGQVEVTPERIQRIVTDVVDGIEIDLLNPDGSLMQNPHCALPHRLRAVKQSDTGEIDNELMLKLCVRHYTADGDRPLAETVNSQELTSDQKALILSRCEDIDVTVKRTRDSFVDPYGSYVTAADAEMQYVTQLTANQERIENNLEPYPLTVMPEKRWIEQITSGMLVDLQVIPPNESRPRIMHYSMIKYMMKVIIGRTRLFKLPETNQSTNQSINS